MEIKFLLSICSYEYSVPETLSLSQTEMKASRAGTGLHRDRVGEISGDGPWPTNTFPTSLSDDRVPRESSLPVKALIFR